MPQQTIFITGGSGYIGSVLIEHAITQGYAITALSRTESSDAKLRGLGASPVRGDLTTLSVLSEHASAADITINLADAIAGQIGKITHEERFAINYAAHAALAEGVKGTSKPLIITSGSLVAGPDPKGSETEEDAPGWPEGHLFRSMMESHTAKFLEMGVNVSYVRLAPYVYGRGGSGVRLYMDFWSKEGSGFYVLPGTARTSTVHVEDAARLYLLVAEKGRPGRSYNATSETGVTQRELSEAVCRTLGVECKALEYGVVEKMMGEFLATFMSVSNRASNRKAREELGWVVRAEKGILEEIETGSYVEVAKALKQGINSA